MYRARSNKKMPFVAHLDVVDVTYLNASIAPSNLNGHNEPKSTIFPAPQCLGLLIFVLFLSQTCFTTFLYLDCILSA